MVLRSIEQKIEALFEGVFGRAFRTHVQPVELARKLGKEMDDHRSISVSRIYVPNEYTVYLAPDDRAQFEGYESSLGDELQTYLAEHARREGYALLTAPRVLFESDDDLSIGEFGIATRMVQPEHGRADGPASEAVPGQTMIYRPDPGPTQAATPEELGLDAEPPTIQWNGDRRELDKRRVLIGRSRECDIQLNDANVSRRHAEIRQEGATFWVVDLDSTNGVEVNGRRLKRAKLEDGDRIVMGSTEMTFRRGA
jgi:FhaA, N-terminal domain/FHA domain